MDTLRFLCALSLLSLMLTGISGCTSDDDERPVATTPQTAPGPGGGGALQPGEPLDE